MTANVCRALLTVFLALCLLSGATASDEFSDALIQDVCVECGSADGHLESCSLYVIPDIIDDSFDTDIPDIVEEPLNPEFSGDDLSSSDAVSSGDDPSSSGLLTGSTEPPVQLSFAEQLLACDDLWGMYSKMLSAMNEDVGILYALTADELAVLKEHANLLYLSIPETTSEDVENLEGIIATLTVLEESLAGTPAAAAVYETGSASSKTTINGVEYICFDLAAGNVVINADTYTGYVFEGGNQKKKVSGTHSPENNYYVYQSNLTNKETTGLVGGTLMLPEYERVGAPEDSGKANWSEYITNNTDVKGVRTNWPIVAKKVGRTNVSSYTISVNGPGSYNITIDNIWSTKSNGLSFIPSTGGKLEINLVGDNRFENILYTSSDIRNSIIFQDSSDSNATLTVASTDGISNYWNSVIGTTDAANHAKGIKIHSGILYAGADYGDVCTAIGGGGNGYGHVTITGGTVTAVTSSSGAAIGGGIAEVSNGGEGYVEITGGTVYAYNRGYMSHHLPSGYSGGDRIFIPSSAIGGGSSSQNSGTKGTVKISGNAVVYAQSVGGTAIGGGSSASSTGGNADVEISGNAQVTAKSVRDYVYDRYGKEFPPQSAGAAIGGGTGKTTGGSATLTVSENAVLNTGSIGGGAGNTIGSAEVTINGGTIIGQVIMQGTGSTFTMNGGTIDNADSAEYNFQMTDGGAVWIQTGEAKMYGGTIKNTKAANGGAIYVSGGSFAMSGGNISSTSATANGGAIYVSGGTVSISGGNITDVSANSDGGAVYVAVTDPSVTDYSFTMSDSAVIQNAKATYGNGGAVAVANGKASMSGGSIKNTTAYVNGGAVSISDGSFTMEGGTIGGDADGEECSANSDGGAVSVTGGEFIMTGGLIQNSETASGNGGAVSVSGGGSASMRGSSVIKSSHAENGYGGAVSISDGSFTMSGGTIGADDSECKAQYGGAVSVTGGTFLMNSTSKIIGGNATVNGGAVYVNITVPSEEDSFTMSEDAEILKSKASVNGGAVCVEGGNALMSGGTIGADDSECKAQYGGAVSVTGGTFLMNSTSKIIGGNATVNGGAVYVNITVSSEGDSFTMSEDAEILKSKASGNGGAVCVEGGNALMSGGTIGGISSNGCSAENGGAVSVTGGTFTMSGSKIQNCTADTDGGGVYVSVDDGDTTKDSFTMSASASIENCTVSSGNGGAVSVSGGSASMSGSSVIKSSHAYSTNNNDVTVGNGGGVSVTGGTFTMSSSKILNCTAVTGGGAVYVNITVSSEEDSFTMSEGASIENCTVFSGNGGAVSVSGGSASMIGNSVIMNSHAENGYGGAVSISNGGFIMSGGTIGAYDSECKARYGGAVSVTGGTFLMNSTSKIIGGNATESGGAVYVKVTSSEGDSFTMSDSAAILNSTASGNGGAVCVEGGSASMLSGTINSSTASDNGGAVSVSGGSFIMSGGTIGAQDAGCSAANGGAVSVTGGTFTMSNSRIQNCTATSNGGAVYVSDGNFNMTTGSLQYCNATKNGGAAYLTGGNFNMDSGAVIYNVADNNGGAVFVKDGDIVVGNKTCKGKDTTHSHPDTKYNRAGVYGGALAVSDGTVTLYCGNITDNTAEKSSDSNTIHQTGGTITVHGGTIGTGVAVIGGNSQYIDKRDKVLTIYFYTATSAQSKIVDEIIRVHHPSVTADYLILNKSKIKSAWTITQNEPADKFVIGWTDDKDWKVGESYLPEGSEVTLTQGGDEEINYYAIWGNAEPNPHCIVVIPETLTIGEGGTGSADIVVDTFEHIPNIGTVTVSLSNFDGKLSLPGYDDSIIYYTLSAGDKQLSSSDLNVTDFTYSNRANVTLTAEVSSTDSARFSGEHSAELTFEISYSQRAYNPRSY